MHSADTAMAPPQSQPLKRKTPSAIVSALSVFAARMGQTASSADCSSRRSLLKRLATSRYWPTCLPCHSQATSVASRV